MDPGFDPAGAVALQVQVSGEAYPGDEAVHTFFDQALERVRAVPGVDAAALTSQLPLAGQNDRYGVQPEGAAEVSPEHAAGVFRYVVTPGYLEAMDVPILEGRRFENRDRGGPPVALISESLARSRFPGQDPVGRRMRVGGNPDWPPFTVVGVVGDVAQASLAPGLADAVYLLPRQWYFADRAMWLVVRTGARTAGLVPAIEDAVWSVDADQPVVRVAALDSLLFGISRLDPTTYAAVVVLVTAVALAASWLPARAAVRVDPATALRVE